MKFQLGGRPAWLSLCSDCGKQKRYLQIFRKVSGIFQQTFNGSKIVLFSSRGLGNFRGLKALRPRPRPRTSKCVLEDSTSASLNLGTETVFSGASKIANFILLLLLVCELERYKPPIGILVFWLGNSYDVTDYLQNLHKVCSICTPFKFFISSVATEVPNTVQPEVGSCE